MDPAYRLAVERHRAGQLDEAEKIYLDLLASCPGDARLLHRLGVVAAQRGRLPEAERYLAESISKDPDHAEAHNNLGNLRQLQGELEEATACYRRCLEIDPSNAKAHFNLGVVMARAASLDEAIGAYRRALEIDPGLSEALHNLGMILLNRNELDEAGQCFERALELNPSDASNHENLGALRRVQGRLAEAADSFIKAMDLDESRDRLRHLVAAYKGHKTDAAPRDYVENLFDEMAETFDDYLVNVLHYRTPSTLKAVLDEIVGPETRFQRLLDLGCGTGLAGAALAGRAGAMWGVDLSRKMLELAKARGIYDKLEAAGMEEFLESAKETFDLVIAADVFVYTGNLARVFELVRGRSEPGALFLFSTEISDGDDYVLNPTGRYGHSRPYIERLAAGADFVVAQCARRSLRREKNEIVMGNYFILQAA